MRNYCFGYLQNNFTFTFTLLESLKVFNQKKNITAMFFQYISGLP